MSDCDKLLRIFLTFEPKKAEDVNYFKCKALLKLMDKKKCKLDDVKVQKKIYLLFNMANTAAAKSTKLSNDEEKQFLDAAMEAANQADEELLASDLAPELASELSSELKELKYELASALKELELKSKILNGGSRRRRASKKHSKKHRKSKKTKSRRH
jgi:hypothetical protein